MRNKNIFITALLVLTLGTLAAFTTDRTSVRQPERKTVRAAYENAVLPYACQIDRYAIPAKRVRVPRVYP